MARELLPRCRCTSTPGANEIAGCTLASGLSHHVCHPYEAPHSRQTAVQYTRAASARRRYRCLSLRPRTCHGAPPPSEHQAQSVTRPGHGRLEPLDRVAFPSKSLAATKYCGTHDILPQQNKHNRNILSGPARGIRSLRQPSKRCRRMKMGREYIDRRLRRVVFATR